SRRVRRPGRLRLEAPIRWFKAGVQASLGSRARLHRSRLFGSKNRSAMDQPKDRSDDPAPVIEPGGEHAELTRRAFHLRIRQQEILAELGVLALQGTPFLELLNQTAGLTAEGMKAEFCKVLAYLTAQNRLLVRAGVGWHEGIVGVATIGADLESPSGFALLTGKPVISNHLENE